MRMYILGIKHLLIAGCALPEYQGDNSCDDENNNEACFFDGGDCCGSNANLDYCLECQCLDYNHPCSDDYSGSGNYSDDDSGDYSGDYPFF